MLVWGWQPQCWRNQKSNEPFFDRHILIIKIKRFSNRSIIVWKELFVMCIFDNICLRYQFVTNSCFESFVANFVPSHWRWLLLVWRKDWKKGLLWILQGGSLFTSATPSSSSSSFTFISSSSSSFFLLILVVAFFPIFLGFSTSSSICLSRLS